VKGYPFGLLPSTLLTAREFPKNAQYYSFAPTGLLNTSSCYLANSPVFYSLPYFAHSNASDDLAARAGLPPPPQRALHPSALEPFYLVEPLTGTALLRSESWQLNTFLAPFPYSGMFPLLVPTFFPNLWLTESSHVSDAWLGDFDAHVTKVRASGKAWALYCGSAAAVFAAIFLMTLSLPSLATGAGDMQIGEKQQQQQKSEHSVGLLGPLYRPLLTDDSIMGGYGEGRPQHSQKACDRVSEVNDNSSESSYLLRMLQQGWLWGGGLRDTQQHVTGVGYKMLSVMDSQSNNVSVSATHSESLSARFNRLSSVVEEEEEVSVSSACDERSTGCSSIEMRHHSSISDSLSEESAGGPSPFGATGLLGVRQVQVVELVDIPSTQNPSVEQLESAWGPPEMLTWT